MKFICVSRGLHRLRGKLIQGSDVASTIQRVRLDDLSHFWPD